MNHSSKAIVVVSKQEGSGEIGGHNGGIDCLFDGRHVEDEYCHSTAKSALPILSRTTEVVAVVGILTEEALVRDRLACVAGA